MYCWHSRRQNCSWILPQNRQCDLAWMLVCGMQQRRSLQRLVNSKLGPESIALWKLSGLIHKPLSSILELFCHGYKAILHFLHASGNEKCCISSCGYTKCISAVWSAFRSKQKQRFKGNENQNYLFMVTTFRLQCSVCPRLGSIVILSKGSIVSVLSYMFNCIIKSAWKWLK